MPQQGMRRIKTALSNLAEQHKNNTLISGNFMKDIPVVKETNYFWRYNKNFRLEDARRANGAPANMATWEASITTYYTKANALKDVITDRDYNNVDAPLMLDRDCTENLTDKILLQYEYDCHQLLFTTSTFAANETILTATSWATTTTNIIGMVSSATSTILLNSCKKPNVGVTNQTVFNTLKNNSAIYNRIQYVERALITEDILAACFDLDNVYIGRSVIDSAKEGDTASVGFVWGGDFLMGYFDPAPGLRKVTAAANFRVTQFGNPYTVKQWREEDVEGKFIEVQTIYQPRAIATGCAFLFKSCIV
jgi:hypothetical protein